MVWSAPATAVAGATATAAWFNQYVRDNFKAIGDPWIPYTPTLTGAGTTQGNAVMTGAYRAAGTSVHFWARAVLGSTTVIGSQVRLLLPGAALSTNSHAALYGRFIDTGTNDYLALPSFATTTLLALNVIGTNGAAVATSATVPFTWVTSDVVFGTGTYDAAV